MDLVHGAGVDAMTAHATLAIPEGWVLDVPGRQRLERQLARAGPGCAAVVAERSQLPPGASYVAWSERRGLIPESEVRPVVGLTVRGAAMVRRGVSFETGGELVTLARGELLLDPGVAVHDPWQPVADTADASPTGRPLDARPVALFLGVERDPYLADWVRVVVNGLVRRGVEGRIAIPEPTGGLHLTKPCAPTEASVDALKPGVVVALDDQAADLVATWVGHRPFGLVRLTPDTTAAVTVERAHVGRSRERPIGIIGRGIDPDSMAELVRRLDLGLP
jgi:hypothetical protein